MDNNQLDTKILACYLVKDDAMGATFNVGETLLMEKVPQSRWSEIRNYAVYLIRTNEDLVLRRILMHDVDELTLLCDKEGISQQPLPRKNIKELWSFKGKIEAL